MAKSKKGKSPKSAGSKNGKSSKSKNSKKGKGSRESGREPPMDAAIQTEPTCVCYICSREFKDYAAVQAHLLLMDHFPPNDVINQQCRACKRTIFIKSVEKHQCCEQKANFIRYIQHESVLKMGPPYRCLLCRSRPFASRIDLSVHIIAYHRPGRDIGCCGLCKFTFQEPPPPAPSKVPTPPAGSNQAAILQYQKDLQLAEEERMCAFENAEIPPGLVDLDRHLKEDHSAAYALLARRALLTKFHLRAAYSCCLCDQVFPNNVEFQAHVLCRHGVDQPIKYDHRICSICKAAFMSEKAFNIHVVTGHQHQLNYLANLWIRREIMVNATDGGQTCGTCWQVFHEDWYLQAHIIAAHTTSDPLVCGWCRQDFTGCSDPIFGFGAFQRHEANHGRYMQERAIELKLCFEPLPEILSEDFSDEAMAAALAKKVEGGKSTGDKSKSKSKGKSKKGKGRSTNSSPKKKKKK
nr:unnamed protein product [Spirometra erinaceieuropaei]